MTTLKIKSMKEGLNEEFAKVFELCQLVLQNNDRQSLLLATLQTLHRFLNWIPLGFIFETNLLPDLMKFFNAPAFRTTVLDCLTEIASLPPHDIPEAYRPTMMQVLVSVMESLIVIIPPDTDLGAAYEGGNDEERLFIQRLALFLATYLKSFLPLFGIFTGSNEQQVMPQQVVMNQVVDTALGYLLRISSIRCEDDEIFKTVLEFWQHFSKELYTHEVNWGCLRGGSGGKNSGKPLPSTQTGFSGTAGAGGLPYGGCDGAESSVHQRFMPILRELRIVMIDHMAKPEEVIVVENEDGEIVREMNKDTEVIAQYKTMREAIVLLTNLNYDDTLTIMLEKLDEQVTRSKFTWGGLNTLCWAIGSVSGAMSEEEEKRFLIIVIKDLLKLCEDQKGKDNKAVVASNIMYIVGQYPRFLRAHWKFLKTVVNKLFEFMHEVHPGVQDMACDTFLKIAQKCKRKFMTIQGDDPEPFIITLITDLKLHTSDLQPHQILSFYESVGTMLSDYGHAIPLLRDQVVLQLLHIQNERWKHVMNIGQQNVSALADPAIVKEVSNIIRTNNRVCQSAGCIYVHQLSIIFLDVLNLYQFYSKQIIAGVEQKGPIAVKHHEYKIMRVVKNDVLDLITTFFEAFKDNFADGSTGVIAASGTTPQVVMQTFLPRLMDEVLEDYRVAPSCARESKVLSLFSMAIAVFRNSLSTELPRIMQAVFESTLELITGNMLDHPEHRVRFFQFLQCANEHCFYGLFSVPPSHQKMVVDSIVWAFKHTDRAISEMGLEILQDLLKNISSGTQGESAQQGEEFAQGFYQGFLLSLIQEILGIMTDRLHKSGFKLQAGILMSLFHLVQTGQVKIPLFDTEQFPQMTDNTMFLKEHVGHLLLEAFPNLTTQQIVDFVSGCFDVNVDLSGFKQHLRDFLINVKEYSQGGDQNEELYDEEKQLHIEQQSEELRAYQKSIPGLLRPSEINEEEL